MRLYKSNVKDPHANENILNHDYITVNILVLILHNCFARYHWGNLGKEHMGFFCIIPFHCTTIISK